MWCEGEERSVPLQVERKQRKHTRQKSAVASFTPVGNLQATDSSNLLQAPINKGILHDAVLNISERLLRMA